MRRPSTDAARFGSIHTDGLPAPRRRSTPPWQGVHERTQASAGGQLLPARGPTPRTGYRSPTEPARKPSGKSPLSGTKADACYDADAGTWRR
jgi:hypothetical protein